jgi:sulfate/thiosulfate transport system substrate-binding protein
MQIKPGTRNHRILYRAVIAVLALGVVIWTLWPWLPFQKRSQPQTLVLYGFAILQDVIEKEIFPAFQKKWMKETGQRVELIGSFAGSGTVTNQLIMGVPAELAILSTGLDVQRLQKAGVIKADSWKKLPYQGVINGTPFVIVVRPGNPKNIHGYEDLARPGIRIVHPDPLTSGAANWAIIAEYGAATRKSKAGPRDGRDLLRGIWQNVAVQAGSARAARTQFEQGFGDALITYEQDVLPKEKNKSPKKYEIIYPRSTIFSEHTLVVISKSVAAEEKKMIQAFVDFLWREEGQSIFVQNGFRSVNIRLNDGNRQFGHVDDLFTIHDFGGWNKAKKKIIDEIWKNGVLKELKR